MARENEYLKVFQGSHVLGVGEKGTKKAHVSNLKPGTKYTDLKVAYDTTSDNSLSKEASEAVAVPEFTTKTPVVNVTGVSLDKTALSLDTGKTGQLKATVKPDNATNKGVNWASDNEGVATVDSNGKVTAVKAGTCNIKVGTKDGNKVAQCEVTVKAKPAPKPEEPAEGK